MSTNFIYLSARAGINLEYMIPSLFTAVALCLRQSTVQAYNQKNKITLYTGLVGASSSGKTTAMNLVKNALYCVEDYLKIPADNSFIYSHINGQAIYRILEHQPVFGSIHFLL